MISSMRGGGGEETTERMWSGCLSVGETSGSGGLSKISVYGVELRTFSRIVLTSAAVLYMTDPSEVRFKKCSLSGLRP